MVTHILVLAVMNLDAKLEAIDIAKWLSVLLLLAGIYWKFRSWEKALSGEGDRTEIIKQPLKIEMQKEFMTRDEHRGVCGNLERRTLAKMENDKVEILDRIEELGQRTQDGFRSLERAIGRLEGGQNK